MAKVLTGLAALAAGLAPLAAQAQSIEYGSLDEGSSGSDTKSGSKERSGSKHRGGRMGSYVTPYIEAQQIVSAELSPGNEVLTYSQIAAGIDATVAGRNNAASVSLRYERRFGWGKASDGDTYSGLARAYASIVPRAVRIDAGALAARSRIENNGAAVLAPLGDDDSVTHLYSIYAGPSISTHAGDVKIDGHYHIGYTKVDSPDQVAVAPGQQPLDVFDKSTVHNAELRMGTRPGEGLPVGIGAGAGYYREEISNLDQRVEDFHAKADITVPLSRDLAAVGGVGYEKVRISSRDALIGANGLPVVAGGRFVTDKSGPRQIAYDVEGLIWDAGVIWRPSRRTQFEAHVGRRYGTTSYFGSLSYAPNDRSSLNVAVYDNIAGFGGQLNRALANMPAEFTANRNPLSGDITGCVASLEQGSCIAGALGSIRSATFRARGVMANFSLDLGRISAGIGGGYDRRKFIAAPGTVLAVANGVIDENYWLSAYLNGRIDQNSNYAVNVYANWFQSGSAFVGDSNAIGASFAYYRNLTDHVSAHAALGIDGISRQDPLEDQWNASALVGVRYTF